MSRLTVRGIRRACPFGRAEVSLPTIDMEGTMLKALLAGAALNVLGMVSVEAAQKSAGAPGAYDAMAEQQIRCTEEAVGRCVRGAVPSERLPKARVLCAASFARG